MFLRPGWMKIWILGSTLTAFIFSFSPLVRRFPRLSEVTSLRRVENFC
jgi:hypothetical protein